MKVKIAIIAVIIAIGVAAYYTTILDTSEPVITPAYAVPILGDPNAPITIEEWGDYQCTFCKRFHSGTLETLKERFIDTGQVKLVFMDFPLNGNASVRAASASYCAEEQGSYWEYHDELYDNWAGENTGWINDRSLVQFAESVDLDVDQFSECVSSGKHNERVLETYAYGQSKDINSTPSFLISNGDKVFKIQGAQPLETFLRVIDNL